MQSNTDFVDMQVKLLIKKFPDSCITELVFYAKDLFHMFEWNYDKIRNSIKRIEKKNSNIIIKQEQEWTKHNYNNCMIKQRRSKKRFRMLIVNDKLK